MAGRQTSPREFPLGLAPRTLFVSGKGGVGKTTVAAALALAYRDAGARTLLVEIEGHGGAAALIGKRSIGYEPVAIAPRLSALRIDSEHALQEYARQQLKVRLIADRMTRNPIFASFAQVAPGLREMLVLGKLWTLSLERSGRGPKYEAIIVDAPATGHGISLLTTAGTIARAFPVGPIAGQSRDIDAFVRNEEQCAAILVALPEEVATNEAVELRDRLQSNQLALGAVIANGVLPRRFDHDDAGRLEWLSTVVEDKRTQALLDIASYEHTRAREQGEMLERLRGLSGTFTELPYLYTDTVGRPELTVLASRLAGHEIEPLGTSPKKRARL